jgi:hypothetical protein
LRPSQLWLFLRTFLPPKKTSLFRAESGISRERNEGLVSGPPRDKSRIWAYHRTTDGNTANHRSAFGQPVFRPITAARKYRGSPSPREKLEDALKATGRTRPHPALQRSPDTTGQCRISAVACHPSAQIGGAGDISEELRDLTRLAWGAQIPTSTRPGDSGTATSRKPCTCK